MNTVLSKPPIIPYAGSFAELIPYAVLVVFFLFAIVVLIVMGQKMSRKFLKPVKESIAPLNEVYASKPICNYYIKGSYNSCASGDYTNDFVSLEALRNVLRNGCRYVDFEVYDIDNKAVVAVSSDKTFHFKGSYNSIPLSDVLKEVKNVAFTMPPNPNDPLFLQFRIKSSHERTCSQIAALLQSNFFTKLMPPQYSYQNQGNNIGAVPLSAFMNHVVIAVEMNNPLVKKSVLMELVNLSPFDISHRVYTIPELAYNAPSDVLTNSNSYLSSLVPDGSTANNFDSNIGFNKGIQIILMQYQKDDANLNLYNKRFNTMAFVEKPNDLMEEPLVVPVVGKQPDENKTSSIMGNLTQGAVMPPFSSEVIDAASK